MLSRFTSTGANEAAAIFTSVRTHWLHQDHYTVLQCGADDGRLLLQCWTRWQLQRDAGEPVPQRLHYIMLLGAADQQPPLTAPRATACADPLNLVAQWLRVWPAATPGYHRLLLAQGQLLVTLVIGDPVQALTQLEASVDCVLLPAPQGWQAPQIKRLCQLVRSDSLLFMPGATGLLAEQLLPAGFTQLAAVASWLALRYTPRFAPRRTGAPVVSVVPASVPAAREAIVIGAGLAGTTVCQRLVARGWQVTLLERHAAPAQEASGNLAGVYMPSISRDDNPTARLTRAAFLFARQLWTQLDVFAPERQIGQACGVLQLARDATQAAAFAEAARTWRYPPEFAEWWSEPEVSERLQMAAGSGWWFPQAGWLRPARLCEAMLEACGTALQRRFHQHAVQLWRVADQWQVLDAEGAVLAQAPVVVLANAAAALQFKQAAELPLQRIRGQVSHVPAQQLPALPMALSGDGYLTGTVDGLVSMGASYDLGDDDVSVRLDSHLGNLSKLRQMLPQWQGQPDVARWQGRVGFRCVSSDRLALIGALPDMAALAAAAEVQLRDVPRHPGLYAVLGFASRGLIWAPLAAEIVASQLSGEPPPLGCEALALLDPARFALKARRRAG